jgi:transposase
MSEKTRNEVMGYLKAGKTAAEAAAEFHVGINAVKRLKRKVRETGSVATRKGQGRKRKLSKKQTRSILNKAKRGKFSPQITREISRTLQEPISIETVRRTIKESKLQYLVVEEEEKLTKKQKKQRIKFARDNVGTDWKLVLFTDEKLFQLPHGVHKQWQDPNDRVKKVKVSKHAPKLMVWGGIGYYFKTPLFFCKPKSSLTSKGYLDILKKNLPPKTRTEDCPREQKDDWKFLQDNASIHKSKSVMGYLEKEVSGYVRNYPAKSPDFNIIEDVWSQMNEELNHYKITNLISLKRHLKKIWKEFSVERVRSSVDSLPNRLKKCIRLSGERTGY